MKFTSYFFTFIFIFCFVLLLCTALQAELVKNYDSDTDMTTINTKPAQIMELNPWKQPRLSLVIQYPGQSPPPSAELVVKMSFISLSRKQKFDNCTEIQCFAEEKQIFRREFVPDTNIRGKSVMETMTVNVPYAEFETMRDADHFEFVICGTELELHRIERKDILNVREQLR